MGSLLLFAESRIARGGIHELSLGELLVVAHAESGLIDQLIDNYRTWAGDKYKVENWIIQLFLTNFALLVCNLRCRRAQGLFTVSDYHRNLSLHKNGGWQKEVLANSVFG